MTSPLSRAKPYLFLALVMLLTTVVRWNLLDIPLERDEGGFAYAGKALLGGSRLYTDVCDLKLPGLYYLYGIITALFGYSPTGVHSGLLLFNLATLVVLFLLARREFGDLTAGIAVAAFAVLSVSPNVLGFAGHATHFLLLPALGGLLLLLRALDSGSKWLFLASGLSLGAAFTIKQQAIYFMLLAGAYLLFVRGRRQPAAWSTAFGEGGMLVLGCLLPYALITSLIALDGNLQDFWFWTFEYPRIEGSNRPLALAWRAFRGTFPEIVRGQSALWILAGLGMLGTFFTGRKRQRFLVRGLTVASAAAVATGFAFRPHYFVLMLPAISILVGLCVNQVKELSGKRLGGPWPTLVALLLFALSWGQVVFANADYFMRPDRHEILRDSYRHNPFPESVRLGRYVRENSAPQDELLILGSEPQILVYARRPSATRHLFMYPLVDGESYNERLQQQLIEETEASKPKFIIAVKIEMSWVDRDPTRNLLDWSAGYISGNYVMVGLAEIGREATTFKWGADARRHEPASPHIVYLFQRL